MTLEVFLSYMEAKFDSNPSRRPNKVMLNKGCDMKCEREDQW